MLPDREGRFKAAITDHGVDETGPNKLATFVCGYQLCEELINGEWVPLDIQHGEMQIAGFHYLEKKDGSINTSTVEQLKSAFGWDGRDPMWLRDADFSQLTVQLTLEFEEYQGRSKLKVKWVDAADAAGSAVTKADDVTRRAISTRLGAKFRAMAGGSPAPAPKPAGKPTAPTAAAPPKPAPTPPPAKTASMEQTWAVFAKQCPKTWQQQDIEREWFRVLGDLFPSVQVESLTPQQWAIALEQAPSKIVPI
jgi:hypothetical protein